MSFGNGVGTGTEYYGDETAATPTVTAKNGSTSWGTQAVTITAAAPATASFTQQPTNTTAASNIAPAVTVTVKDSFGNLVGSSNVTLTANGFSFASGTLTQATNSSGVATFSNLVINTAGTGYTISAGDGSASATSTSFSVTVGAATKLVITTQPSSTANSGAALGTQPVVKVEDSGGNVVTSVNSGTASASIASGSGGSIAAGGTSGTFSNGVATFSGLALNGVNGTAYTLTFAGDTFTSAASNTITMSTGAATQLVVTTQPSGAASGSALTGQPVVKVEDSGGNVVTPPRAP